MAIHAKTRTQSLATSTGDNNKYLGAEEELGEVEEGAEDRSGLNHDQRRQILPVPEYHSRKKKEQRYE